MRFMVIVKADEISERGTMPTEEMLSQMGKFNEELASKGKMLAGEGLQPSSKGARITFRGTETEVREGPFPIDNLIAGFWIIQADSLQEAVDLMRRAPMLGDPESGEVAELEIRQIFEAEDFGTSFTDEMREREETLRQMIDRQREQAA